MFNVSVCQFVTMNIELLDYCNILPARDAFVI